MTVKALLFLALLPTGAFAQARSSADQSGGPSLGPCEDFYQYTCGAWLAANPIPKAEASWGVANELHQRNTATLREILEGARVADVERPPVKRVIGDFYESCMDTEQIQRRGTKGLAQDLAQIAAIHSAQSLQGVIVALHAKGINPFWIVSAQPDPRHSTVMQADISQSGFSLPGREYYVRQDPRSIDLRTKLQAHIRAMFLLLGDAPGQAASQAAAIVKLETQMAQAALERQEQIDPQKTTHRVTFTQLQAMMPHFDWTRYVAAYARDGLDGVERAVTRIFERY